MTKILWGTLILMAATLSLLGQGNITIDTSQHFSAARNFSFASNPNGEWSYGYTFGLSDAFNLFTGWFQEESCSMHGFVFQNNAFTVFDVPGAAHSQGLDINNGGDIVGAFDTGDITTSIGFVWRNGRFASFEVPGSPSGTTSASGVNDEGQLVGIYGDALGNSHAFLRSRGMYRTIDLPHSDSTLATGINEAGSLAGNYFPDDATGTHGFVLKQGKATIVEFPVLMSRTRVRGINEQGALVGFYSPDGTTVHAFVGKPAE